MKNKTIKIAVIAVVAVAVLTAGIILLTQFSGLNGVNKNIAKSMKSVKTVTATVTVTDSNIQVYGLDCAIELDGDNAEIVKAESVLNSSFELVRQSEKRSSEKIDRTKLFNLDLKGDYLSSGKYENGVFTAQISAENASKVFGNAVKPNEKADLTITIENKLLKSVKLCYEDNSGKQVELLVDYAY